MIIINDSNDSSKSLIAIHWFYSLLIDAFFMKLEKLVRVQNTFSL